MNIFFLHFIPRLCALYHCDKHVVKMILETCQLLCSAHHVVGDGKYVPVYRLTHKNHPCTRWVRESIQNYIWLSMLGIELCREYTHRYGRRHKCQDYIEDLQNNFPDVPSIGLTLPALAMPDMYKPSEQADGLCERIEAYRQYYFFEKQRMLRWKNREVPAWITEMYETF